MDLLERLKQKHRSLWSSVCALGNQPLPLLTGSAAGMDAQQEQPGRRCVLCCAGGVKAGAAQRGNAVVLQHPQVTNSFIVGSGGRKTPFQEPLSGITAKNDQSLRIQKQSNSTHLTRIKCLKYEEDPSSTSSSEGGCCVTLVSRIGREPSSASSMVCQPLCLFLQGDIKEIISELRPSTEHFTLNGKLRNL
ncbi:uncharacterized protein LOC136019642 [Lathamus discolor]|uniref:uncharacterized protein LOC136019642 n=1 Tax=Lathamus discolor TaxID=678569 RepID=UPI0032B85EEF